MEDDSLEWVRIRQDDYDELLHNQRFLQALQAAGVDNWEGYEHAQDMMREEN